MSTTDFRTRVAAEKRERMRTRLIESALQVFNTKGVDHTVIEDLITHAQVSRGTFYNHFRTTDEALAAVLHELGNELLMLVDAAIVDRPDPAERLACGVRMVLHAARQFPQAGLFLSRVGITRSLDKMPTLAYLMRDLLEATEAGRFTLTDPMLGMDLVVGTTTAALFSLSMRTAAAEDYPQDIAFHILLGLGMPRSAARKLADKPIPTIQLPPEALLVRTHQAPGAAH
jgi:AcrR family transcriptional regulator